MRRRRLNLCGFRLRELREARHLSIAEVRETLQKEYGLVLTDSDLVGIETETRRIFDVELSAFACFFHVSPERLIWGETPPDQLQIREMLRIVTLPHASQRSRHSRRSHLPT